MAQKKISQLPNTETVVLSSDLLPIVNDGTTKNIILSAFFAGIDPQTTVDANVRALTGGWEDTLTVVQTNSAAWAIDTFVDTEMRDLSSKWEDTSTVVQTNSAAWAIDNFIDTDVRSLTANWEDTSTVVQANSAAWVLDGGNTKGSDLLVGTTDEFNLNFKTNNLTRVAITSSGNVGINELAPEGKLHVVAGSAGSVVAQVSSVGVFESSGNAYLSLLSPNSNYAGVVMGGPTNSYGSYVSWNHDNLALKLATNHTGGFIQLLAGTEQEAVRIASSGNVGIGTTTPNEKLTVVGDISASGNYKFGSTTTAPSNTTTPVDWVEVYVGTTSYKMPLYQ
jgi:hypothetical protein